MAGQSAHRGPFVIIAEFEVKPDQLEQFLELARTDASHSVEREPGCRQFDVCRDPADPSVFFLYELYDDDAAIQAHLQTPHYLRMNQATAAWVDSKKVLRYVRAVG